MLDISYLLKVKVRASDMKFFALDMRMIRIGRLLAMPLPFSNDVFDGREEDEFKKNKRAQSMTCLMTAM
jgi:hypothetical protein